MDIPITRPDKFDTQYDLNDLTETYASMIREIQDSDPGRTFIYGTISRYDQNAILLDIGCGSGMDIEEYSRMGFANLYGIDPSEWFIQIAKKNLGEKGVFQVWTFENSGFKDNSVDIITSKFSLHYVKDLEKTFMEVWRILKKWGKFVFIVSHPAFDENERKDQNGNVTASLFNGKVPIVFPLHTLEDYVGRSVQLKFKILNRNEYIWAERDISNDGLKGIPTALCIEAEKI